MIEEYDFHSDTVASSSLSLTLSAIAISASTFSPQRTSAPTKNAVSTRCSATAAPAPV